MPDPDQILLQTKLHRPRQPRDLVVRARLIELLNNDLDRQLILVCAPAGFGKTTLVGTWLDQLSAGQDHKAASLPSAWLSLDEKDNDLNLFLRYVIAALRKVFKNACPETTALLQARQLLPKSVFYATFINELVNLPGKVVLVLDDYHIIHDPDVHNLLGNWSATGQSSCT